ncbi:MAG: TIGR03663 family protein, partial [Blastocatellia bacterium]|nr:TIGR03663 family protein [Blastocatellia bacterium]
MLLTAIMVGAAIIVAIWFRFYMLDIKPFHPDEGVMYYFTDNLTNTGEYRYDPANYHGPTLYYLGYITQRIFGPEAYALRFWPALFGVLTVALLWFLRHHLGKVGTPVAAICMAISPGLVYYSRDYIHEMSFGCFTLGIVVGALRYAESKKFGWLVLMSASAALLTATKETVVINLSVLILALICASVWVSARRLIREDRLKLAAIIKELKSDLAGVLPTTDQFLAALVIFVFIYILFYSSLFSHWR